MQIVTAAISQGKAALRGNGAINEPGWASGGVSGGSLCSRFGHKPGFQAQLSRAVLGAQVPPCHGDERERARRAVPDGLRAQPCSPVLCVNGCKRALALCSLPTDFENLTL